MTERSTNFIYDEAISRVEANQAVVIVPSRGRQPDEIVHAWQRNHRWGAPRPTVPKPWLSCWALDRGARRCARHRSSEVRAAFLIALAVAARGEATQAGLIFQD